MLLLLVVLGLGALALYLPRLVNSPAVRERIETAARDATGRDVSWSDLDFGLIPPRLVVTKAVVAGDRPGAAPFAEVDAVGLELALAPLLARAIVVDSLSIEGATVRLVRTDKGIALPGPARTEESAGAGGETGSGEGGGFALAVKQLELSNARVILDDKAVHPETTWDLRDVNLRAHADSLDGPIPFELSGALAQGGRVRGKGSATLAGRADVDLDIDSFPLEPVVPYVKALRRAGGVLSGSVSLRGQAARPDSVEADLRLAKAVVEVEDLSIEGDAAFSAHLSGPGLSGPFEIDATGASLRYGNGLFQKPPGTQAKATGRIFLDEKGNVAVDYQVKIHTTDASGRVETGKRTQIQVDSKPFDLRGWDQLVPQLAEYGLSGPVTLDNVRVVTAPLEVRGKVDLGGVRASVAKNPPVEVRGVVEGRGDAVQTDGLDVTTAGQTLHITGGVSDLGGRRNLAVRASGRQLDGRTLLATFTSLDDEFEGPVDVNADLRGSLAGGRPFSQAVQGKVRLDVGQGRIRGVSLLKGVFQQLGEVAALAVQIERARGSTKLERFYEDEFQSIGGTFLLGDGRGTTDDLRIVYRHYTVDLAGQLDFATTAYTMHGQLEPDAEVDAALGGGSSSSRRPPIPLDVRGRLDQPPPRVTLTRQTLQTLALHYAASSLGGKEGEAVRDILEGVLGGGKRR